jgi:hypothetical protein
MNTLRRHGWRIALVVSAVAMVNGGRLHPDSEGADPLREELAAMTSDPSWVPGHSLIVAATVLLVVGLRLALRREEWPATTRRALRVTSVVLAAYVVETVFHLASAVDTERLAAGEAAPTTYAHLGLALVLYPVTGLALAWLALTLARREWSGASVALAVPGVLGGLAHAISVPLTFVLPDTEVSPIFPLAGMLLAAWALAAGLVRVRSSVASSPRTPVPA